MALTAERAHLDVANDSLPNRLGFCEAFLHPGVGFNGFFFAIHQLRRNMVNNKVVLDARQRSAP